MLVQPSAQGGNGQVAHAGQVLRRVSGADAGAVFAVSARVSEFRPGKWVKGALDRLGGQAAAWQACGRLAWIALRSRSSRMAIIDHDPVAGGRAGGTAARKPHRTGD